MPPRGNITVRTHKTKPQEQENEQGTGTPTGLFDYVYGIKPMGRWEHLAETRPSTDSSTDSLNQSALAVVIGREKIQRRRLSDGSNKSYSPLVVAFYGRDLGCST